MSNEKSTPCFFSPNGVEQEVNGEKKWFYPAPVQAAFDLRQVAKPLLKAFMSLTGGVGQENAAKSHVKTTKTKNAEGSEQEIVEDLTEQEGISPQMAAVKLQERDRAINELVDAFTSPDNAKVMARLIMACMRDDFPRRTPTDAEVKDFLANVDMKSAAEMIRGTIKANAEVFGSAGPKLMERLTPTE